MNKKVFSARQAIGGQRPPNFTLRLDRAFAFEFDPCRLDGEDDGLLPLFCTWRGQRVFCNPPYGPGLAKWLKRGPEATVSVFLLPARTDPRWFHEIVLPHATEIRFLRGRLKFSGAKNCAPFPSMLVIFGERRICASTADSVNRNSPGLRRETAARIAKQCRHVVQGCLREEEWQDADDQFEAIILTGLSEVIHDADSQSGC